MSSKGNEETKAMIDALVKDIDDTVLAYRLATTDDNRKRLLAVLELRAAELKAFIKKARDNEAI